MGVFKVFIYNWAPLGSSWCYVHFTSTKSRTTLIQTFCQKCMWDENKETRKLFKKPKKIHWVQCNASTTRHMVWFGDQHKSWQTRSETHTLEMDTQDTEQNNGSAWIPPTCEMCSGMMIRPCYKHSASSVNKVNQKKEKKRKMRSRRGIWAARWMSRSYLSIQKICWRWGSDRCPFRMLPRAAWVWKEQERRKGHWALAWNKLTQGKKIYISHMKGLRRSNQMEAATHKSTRTSKHKLVGWQKS